MPEIKNIIFDFGAVLLPINYGNITKGFEQLGIENSQAFYSQKSQTDIFDQLERGQISGAEFLKHLHSMLPNSSEAKILDVWNSILGELPITIPPFLAKVAKHYRIFLLSNTNELHQAVFEKNIKTRFHESLDNWFENIYYSHLTGFRKPEKEIFHLVLMENNLQADETLFIEDTVQNLTGAHDLGIQCLFLDVHNGATTQDYFELDGTLKLNVNENIWKP